VPFNFPQVPVVEENQITFLKSRELLVDGYSIIIYYNKANWNSHFMETLQIVGKYIPFLPFCLICKIGKRFLGDQYLSFVEIFRDSRRIYCWTLIRDRERTPIPLINEHVQFKDCSYEGFSYRCLNPKEITFY
jgi:hypothetical protein